MGIGVELGVGYIETFAGNGKARSTGDGKLAVKAGIPLPVHVAVDKEERYLYFAESGSDRVRRVDLKEGTLHNFAASGRPATAGMAGRAARRVCIFPSESHLTLAMISTSVTRAAIGFGKSTTRPASLPPWSERGSGDLMEMGWPWRSI